MASIYDSDTLYQCHESSNYDAIKYSSLPNKRTGLNFDKNQISVQGGILIKTLEYRVKTGYFIDNKKEF